MKITKIFYYENLELYGIGKYNIWRFVEIIDLARFGEIIQKQLGSQLIHYRKKYWLDLNLVIHQFTKFSSSPIFVLIWYIPVHEWIKKAREIS